MSNLPNEKYAKKYSEEGFFGFIKKFGKKIGEEALIMLFKLWFVLSDGHASTRTKMLVLAALGYTVSPIDLVPDLVPFIGLTDDIAVLGATVSSVAGDITPAITEKAEQKVHEIIG